MNKVKLIIKYFFYFRHHTNNLLLGNPDQALNVSGNFSQPFLSRGTLGQLYQHLAALLDTLIGLNDFKIENWRHP